MESTECENGAGGEVAAEVCAESADAQQQQQQAHEEQHVVQNIAATQGQEEIDAGNQVETAVATTAGEIAGVDGQYATVGEVSLISPEGQLVNADGNNAAIFLLVTGTDGQEATPIAITASTANALSFDPSIVASAGIQIANMQDIITSSVGQGGTVIQNPDAVNEILSSIMSGKLTDVQQAQIKTEDGTVAVVHQGEDATAANTEVIDKHPAASAAPTTSGGSFPSASEMSLAQDILALASSALSSSLVNNSTPATGTTSNLVTSAASNSTTVTASACPKISTAEHAQMNAEDQQAVNALEGNVPQEPTGKAGDLPNWAAELQDCMLIYDHYCGFVTNEVDMDRVLNLYKKETQSLFAVRQTPSPVKETDDTIRLMWKSLHVPYDGVPFINIGRRATVMECEHGPRKRTNALKRMLNATGNDEALKKIPNLTCPARLFIKKVRKFPEFKVAMDTDLKSLRQMQEHALKQLRLLGFHSGGEVRYYLQLPVPSAHRYHFVNCNLGEEQDNTIVDPRLVEKITEWVRQGITGAFVVRQLTREFVEKELFPRESSKPEKQNKSFYPPLIEIQNIIQQAQADVSSGVLSPLPPPEVMPSMVKTKRRKSTSRRGSGLGLAKRMRQDGMDDSGDESRDAKTGVETQTDSGNGSQVNLSLPDYQLNNFSVSNLSYDQLSQLAKIGLLALNNAAFSKGGTTATTTTTTVSATTTIADEGTTLIESSHGADTASILAAAGLPPDSVVFVAAAPLDGQELHVEQQQQIQAAIGMEQQQEAKADDTADAHPQITYADAPVPT